VLAQWDKDGRIKVRWRRIEAAGLVSETRPDGRVVGVSKTVTKIMTARYKATDVKAYDTNGKAIAAEKLAKLLKKEVPVLVSADREKVDPLHLRLVKEGTVILVLPKPLAGPPVPGGLAPPPGGIGEGVAPPDAPPPGVTTPPAGAGAPPARGEDDGPRPPQQGTTPPATTPPPQEGAPLPGGSDPSRP
jgi:hypothetical protein